MDDEMYGLHTTPTDHDHYSQRAAADSLMMSDDPQNLIMINPCVDYSHFNNMLPSCYNNNQQQRRNILEEYSVAAAAVTNNHDHQDHFAVMKAKIASHPCYPKLIDAYIDCQKVGAPPEMTSFLDEVRREKGFCKFPMSLGIDPELDEFMETYYDILVKYKSDLSRPFDEATSFLNKIETQLGNLCKDDGSLSSDDELSGGDMEAPDAQTRTEDRELKDKLLRRYGSHISSLKLEFSKKKKKGKLPKESRQTLLEWWNVHYKWPYPTEADKISLAELTGLDQKQINNWFINQRKRHWKPSENMQLAIMNNLSGHFFTDN